MNKTLAIVLIAACAIPHAVAAEQAQPMTALSRLHTPADAPLATPAYPPKPISKEKLAELLADPTIRSFVGLSENSWDFEKPDAIPGFGPMPVLDHLQW